MISPGPNGAPWDMPGSLAGMLDVSRASELVDSGRPAYPVSPFLGRFLDRSEFRPLNAPEMRRLLVQKEAGAGSLSFFLFVYAQITL
jgi:hypothetical protein